MKNPGSPRDQEATESLSILFCELHLHTANPEGDRSALALRHDAQEHALIVLELSTAGAFVKRTAHRCFRIGSGEVVERLQEVDVTLGVCLGISDGANVRARDREGIRLAAIVQDAFALPPTDEQAQFLGTQFDRATRFSLLDVLGRIPRLRALLGGRLLSRMQAAQA